MPQPDTKLDSMDVKRCRECSSDTTPTLEGFWSGDYPVADYAPFKNIYDVARAKVKVHCIKEVVRTMSG